MPARRYPAVRLNGPVRVVFLTLDGLPWRHVGPVLTPNLEALIEAGGAAAHGGLAEIPATTYPNHRTFATGRRIDEHGTRVNDERATLDASPTIFDVCAAHGVSVEAVVGDHHLVDVIGASRADARWPPGGVWPVGTALDEYGYATDDAVLEHLLPAAERRPTVLVGQLNDPDTAGHVFGSDTDAAHERYHATDRALGHIVDSLRTEWDDLVLLVVSDHDHEMISAPPTDLRAEAENAGVPATVHEDGSAALVLGGDDLGRWLTGRALDPDDPGILGTMAVTGGWIVWPRAGGWYAPATLDGMLAGIHGSPRTETQLAVVSGGHPMAGALAAVFGDGIRPNARDWAPTIASLLDVPMPSATGRALV